MAKGGYGGFGGGMPNMNNLMKQAQKMQRQMEETQKGLEEREFEATSGGGAVKAVINGAKQFKAIEISPDIVEPPMSAEDAEMLQDMLLAAVNEALRQADETVSREMGKITGGMGMPGMF